MSIKMGDRFEHSTKETYLVLGVEGSRAKLFNETSGWQGDYVAQELLVATNWVRRPSLGELRIAADGLAGRLEELVKLFNEQPPPFKAPEAPAARAAVEIKITRTREDTADGWDMWVGDRYRWLCGPSIEAGPNTLRKNEVYEVTKALGRGFVYVRHVATGHDISFRLGNRRGAWDRVEKASDTALMVIAGDLLKLGLDTGSLGPKGTLYEVVELTGSGGVLVREVGTKRVTGPWGLSAGFWERAGHVSNLPRTAVEKDGSWIAEIGDTFKVVAGAPLIVGTEVTVDSVTVAADGKHTYGLKIAGTSTGARIVGAALSVGYWEPISPPRAVARKARKAGGQWVAEVGDELKVLAGYPLSPGTVARVRAVYFRGDKPGNREYTLEVAGSSLDRKFFLDDDLWEPISPGK